MTVAKRTKRVKPDPELVKLADSLLANYQKPEDLIGENGLLKQPHQDVGRTGSGNRDVRAFGPRQERSGDQCHGQYPQRPQRKDVARRVWRIAARYPA